MAIWRQIGPEFRCPYARCLPGFFARASDALPAARVLGRSTRIVLAPDDREIAVEDVRDMPRIEDVERHGLCTAATLHGTGVALAW